MQIDGVTYPWPHGVAPPSDILAQGVGLLATRPTEIDFLSDGGVRGVVARKAYLGEVIDYRVQIGETQVRVQKTRHVAGPAVGDPCGLSFSRPHWYAVD
jgi:iron(III) transport system ATP-binding protein